MTIGESFDQVLAAARTGAEWAWRILYRDLAPLVRAYVRGRGAHDPDDITGEVFIGVVRQLPSFSGGEREFRTWVLTIAHRRLVDVLRQGSRRVAEVPSEDPGDRSEVPSGDVEQEALERLSTRRVLDSLAMLSPDQQAVLTFRILSDLTIEEIATILDKRSGAVKALQRRGLARLKKEISPNP